MTLFRDDIGIMANLIKFLKSLKEVFDDFTDRVFPLKNPVKPFLNVLRTKSEDKKLMLYNDSHSVPKRELIKESLAFMDTYFGKVQ